MAVVTHTVYVSHATRLEGPLHVPPVLRPTTDSNRQRPTRWGPDSFFGRNTVQRNADSEDVASESAEVMWTWAPRLMIGLAVLVVALEVMPRGSSLIAEIRTWRADASRVATLETLEEDRGDVRVERAKLARKLAEASTERATTGDMLSRLDAFAADASVNLTRVEPGLPLAEGAQERVPLAVDLTGRFHDVGRYVSELEASTFQVQRLALTHASDPRAMQSSSGGLEASLALEIVRAKQSGGRDE